MTEETDPLGDAAEAFKTHLGQSDPEPPEEAETPPEDEAEPEPPEEEETEAEEAEGDPNSEPPTPNPVDLPASWQGEADLWSTLSPEIQAKVAERERARDAELAAARRDAAELRAAGEAERAEARAGRGHYAEAIDKVMALVKPAWPPATMLEKDAADYDPDKYHLLRARAEQQQATLAGLEQERARLAAEEKEEADRARLEGHRRLDAATRDAFLRDVPDATDRDKAVPLFHGLIDYAVGQGTPPELFDSPTTSLEWHLLWKAREYDRLQAATQKVRNEPKPEPRKPRPALRPGVAAPPGAAARTRAGAALDRLRSEGTIEAGAAALKHLLKGNLS